MTYARKTLICLQDTPYYHVIARCVRRAWLWGFDEYAGRDYSHRKSWVLERLAYQASVFAIDVCAFAILSNHYHLVLHVDSQRARAWSRKEVVARWMRLFSRPTLIQRWEENVCGEAEREAAEAIIERWRARLMDVSWYMRCLNEYLARRANAEDDCTGRFWEGRFRSQALLDEAGLLTAMAYVDLNPIRAGIAATPEESEFTSIYERIRAVRITVKAEHSPSQEIIPPLLPFKDDECSSRAITFSFPEYLALVDWTGRTIREEKTGHIDPKLPPIATRLHIDPMAWRAAMQPRGNVFGRALGQLDHLRLHAKALGQSRIKGMSAAQRCIGRRRAPRSFSAHRRLENLSGSHELRAIRPRIAQPPAVRHKYTVLLAKLPHRTVRQRRAAHSPIVLFISSMDVLCVCAPIVLFISSMDVLCVRLFDGCPLCALANNESSLDGQEP